MRVLRVLMRVLGWFGVLLLTLLTLAVSVINLASVTPYWAMIALGGAGLFLAVAILAGAATRLARGATSWKTVKKMVVIACVFLAQLPFHMLVNTACSLAVRAYLEGQVPQLEAYHRENSRYPGTLDEAVKNGGALLKLSGQWSSYSVYNERSSYRLSVQRPVSPGQYVYDPAVKGWR